MAIGFVALLRADVGRVVSPPPAERHHPSGRARRRSRRRPCARNTAPDEPGSTSSPPAGVVSRALQGGGRSRVRERGCAGAARRRRSAWQGDGLGAPPREVAVAGGWGAGQFGRRARGIAGESSRSTDGFGAGEVSAGNPSSSPIRRSIARASFLKGGQPGSSAPGTLRDANRRRHVDAR